MRMPDAAAALPERELRQRFVVGGGSFATLDGDCFLRALLPVPLTGGHEYHFGVWLEVSEAMISHAAEVWDEPDYATLVVNGRLANSVPPWGRSVLGAPCRAVVRSLNELPYIEWSSQPALARILHHPWAREECESLIEQYWG